MNNVNEGTNNENQKTKEEFLYNAYKELRGIVAIESHRKPAILQFQTEEDITQDIFTYQYGKYQKGKGLFKAKESYDAIHYKNIAHFETRNHINYALRKTKTQMELNNTISLDQPAYLYDTQHGPNKTVGDLITEEKDQLRDNTSIDLDLIVSRIDGESTTLPITIKYFDGDSGRGFNYRTFTKLYFDLFNGKKLTSKALVGTLFNSNTGEELEKDEIDSIIKNYKMYITKNHIFGGVTL